ncbi:hypothetical protein K432DRAFT_1963 [Lepidopterella palustris CBS 459.81]|uniref:Secreted protein n=1 Tax=Lepidopterella palustris CBS 459.81 TaxID=1314670 RepID=A0A8E2ELY2_9PEZI|nr:hypothetical protein K432DRAFT_1963 [Lepidopterella palustris CBS 459.81]
MVLNQSNSPSSLTPNPMLLLLPLSPLLACTIQPNGPLKGCPNVSNRQHQSFPTSRTAPSATLWPSEAVGPQRTPLTANWQQVECPTVAVW